MDCSPSSSSSGFSWQKYLSGLPFPSPGDLPDPGIKLGSPPLQADSLPSEPVQRKGCSILHDNFYKSENDRQSDKPKGKTI